MGSFINRHYRIIFLIQLMILAAAGCLAVYKVKNPQIINIDMVSCVSDYASYNGDEFYFDETIIEGGTWQDALTVNNIALPAGSYSLCIDYECLSDKMFAIYDGTPANSYLKGDVGYLRSERQTEVFKFRTVVGLDSMVLKIKYEPFGYLKIKNIYIMSNIENLKRLIFCLFILFGLSDILWLKRNRMAGNKNTVFALSMLVLLSSLPLFIPDLHNSLDLEFALLRIEGDFLELKKGVFPIKMVDLFLKGYGYPVHVFYGDVFLYFPVMFRMFGFNITEAWKMYILVNNIATVVLSYFCFNRMSRNKYIAYIMTCLYATAPFRISNLYVRSACGEYTALTFYPLIAMVFYEIYTQELTREKIKKLSTLFAIGMSCLLCTHLLSTEMMCFALLLTALAAFRITFTGNVLKTIGLSVAKTLLFSAWFLVPFIDYYINVPTMIRESVSENVNAMQIAGAYATEWISLYPNEFMGTRFPCSPGIVLMLAIPFGIYLWMNGRAGAVMKISLTVSCIMLALSSSYFPWDYLAKYTHIGRLLAQVQFPVRYVGIAIIFMVVMLGSILAKTGNEQNMRNYVFAAVICAVVSTSLFSDMFLGGRTVTSYTNTSNLNTMNLVGDEYVRVGTKKDDDLRMEIKEQNGERVMAMEKQGAKLAVYYDASADASDITVPVYNYKGYRAVDENGTEYGIRDGMNNLITFTLPPTDTQGRLFIMFSEPLYWRAAELLSLLYIFAAVFMKIRDMKPDKRMQS